MRSPCVTSAARYFCTHSSWNTCRSLLAKWLKFTLGRIGKPRHRAQQSEPPEHKPSAPGSPPSKRPAPRPQQGWFSSEGGGDAHTWGSWRPAWLAHRTGQQREHRPSARPQREGEVTVESVCVGVGGQGGYGTGGVSCQIRIKSGAPWGMSGGAQEMEGQSDTQREAQAEARATRGKPARGQGRSPRSRAVFRSESSFRWLPLRSLPPAQPPSPALASAPDTITPPPSCQLRPVTAPFTRSRLAQRIALPG